MRVALLTNLPAPYRIQFFAALSRHHEVTLRVLFCPDRTEFDQRGWGCEGLDFDFAVLPSWIPRLRHRAFWFNPELLGHLARFRPDAIVAWSSFAGIFAAWYSMRAHVPLILWIGGTSKSEARIDPLRYVARRLLFRQAARFLAYSELAREYLESWGRAPESISILGNVTMDPGEYRLRVRASRAQGERMQRARGWTSRVILTVGRLVERKNQMLLLKAYQSVKMHVPDAALLIAGDGPERGNLERYCVDNDLTDVFFAGAVPAEQMPAYYSIAAVFAHPALYDLWPQAINEAMSAGLPVLVSQASGLPADLVVDGRNGYRIASEAPDEWALRLKSLLMSDKLLADMGAQSFRAISSYGPERAVGIAVQTIKQAIGVESQVKG
jgi:glycosyltransferase involved in cell wall biosynthesis